jgi:ATP-binding cassette subfamily C protein
MVAARLLTLVKPLLPVMLGAILLGTLGFLAAIALPVGGAAAIAFIDSGLSPLPLFILLVTCGVLRGFLRYLEQYANHYIAFRILAHIRSNVFAKLRELAPARLEVKDKGSLVSLITTDIELLEVFYAHTVSPVAIALLVSTAMALFIGSFDWRLGALAACAYLVSGAALPYLASRLNKAHGIVYREAFSDLSSFVLESLRGLRELVQFAAGGRRLAVMGAKTAALKEMAGRIKIREGATAAAGGLLIVIFSLLVLLASLSLYNEGQLEASEVLVCTVAMLSSFGPVTALVSLAGGLTHTMAAARRVLGILDESPQSAEVPDDGSACPKFDGARFCDVTFGYGAAAGGGDGGHGGHRGNGGHGGDGGHRGNGGHGGGGRTTEPVLRGLSLSLPQRGIVGVSGPSGSGKSTMLRLLMRFWDPDSGAVEVAGRPLRDTPTAHLRSIESFMTQDTDLFSGSIADNIRIANAQASQEQVEEACRKAALHDFIASLPQGYDTPVAECGESLSGGERQRIGLARAFLRNSPLMLLDEPTSNLDSLGEAIVLSCLSQEARDKSVVLVSHRASTLGITDKVIAFEDGRLASLGAAPGQRG